MIATIRKSGLTCLIGQHKHGPVTRVDRRLYSECYHCGGDLIRKGRRWRRARADELPQGWTAQPQPTLVFPWPLLIAVVAIALTGAALYIALR